MQNKTSTGDCMNKKNKKKSVYKLTRSQKCYLFIKRLFDIAISSVALVLLLPVFAVIAVLVKLDSKGPAIFKQERVGKNGKIFTIYKFRTMYTSAPKNVATEDLVDSDRLITKIGRFIRCTSIDELPQLFNVLKGDMSLIGPRPLVKTENDVHELRIEKGVYQLRPGLTGLAQTRGRDLVCCKEKVRLDEQYLHTVSLIADMKLFFYSIKVILKREGFSEGSEINHSHQSEMNTKKSA